MLATNGNTHLGGDDIDNLLLQIAFEDIQADWGEDVSVKSDAVQLLRRAVIQAKEQLSFVPSIEMEFRIRSGRGMCRISASMFSIG